MGCCQGDPGHTMRLRFCYSHSIRQEFTCCRIVSEFQVSFKEKQQHISLSVNVKGLLK